MRKYIQIPLLSLFLLTMGLLVAPQQAEADFFTSTWHKAKKAAHHAGNSVSNAAHHAGNSISNAAHHAGNSISNAAHHAGNSISNTAHHAGNQMNRGGRTIGNWTQQQAKLAREHAQQARNSIRRTTEDGWNALKKFAQHPEGNCEQFQRDVRGSLSGAVPVHTFDNIPKGTSTAFMADQACKSDMIIGFNCGIFPYAGGIASALKQGSRAAKHFAYAVGKAARGICHQTPLSVRADCAIAAAVAQDARKSFQCIKDIAGEYGKSKVSRNINKQRICTMAGEFGFGIALDYATANGAGAYKKSVQYAQKLRTALSLSSKIAMPRSCRM